MLKLTSTTQLLICPENTLPGLPDSGSRHLYPVMDRIKKTFCLLFLICHLATAQQEPSIAQDLSAPFLEKLMAAANKNYPKGRIFEARVAIADQGVQKAKLSYFDILSFSYLFSPRHVNATVNPALITGYQFGFFANVGSLLQKPAVIKQARSELKVAQYERETFDLNFKAEIEQRYYLYVQRKVLFRVIAQGLLDHETRLKEVRYKFEKGEETLDNYNKALLAYSGQLQNKITAEGEILIAKSSLEELIGQKLEDVK